MRNESENKTPSTFDFSLPPLWGPTTLVYKGKVIVGSGETSIQTYADVRANGTYGILDMKKDSSSGKIFVSYIEDHRGGILAEPKMELVSEETVRPESEKYGRVSHAFNSVVAIATSHGESTVQTAEEVNEIRRAMWREKSIRSVPIPDIIPTAHLEYNRYLDYLLRGGRPNHAKGTELFLKVLTE